jgi:hypothetical protein
MVIEIVPPFQDVHPENGRVEPVALPLAETIRSFVTILTIKSCGCLCAVKRLAVTGRDGLSWNQPRRMGF